MSSRQLMCGLRSCLLPAPGRLCDVPERGMRLGVLGLIDRGWKGHEPILCSFTRLKFGLVVVDYSEVEDLLVNQSS